MEKTPGIGARTKGSIMLGIGAVLLVVSIAGLNLSGPSLIRHVVPIKEVLEPGEFVAKPDISDSQVEIVKDLLRTLFGHNADEPFHLLIFPQDYLEARPTGGFPGTYLLTSAENGEIKSIEFDDIWNFDRPREREEKPQLSQYAWWAHFPRGAKYAAEVYKEETGQVVDGILAIDPTGIKYILEAIGPIDVPDFSVVVDEENITDKILEFSPYLPDSSGAAQHKTFMGAIVKGIEVELSNYDTLIKRDLIAKVFLRGLERKHILLHFDDNTRQRVVRDNNWDGRIYPAEADDFLAVRDYNAGINKVDLYVDRNIKYEVELSSQGTATSRLEIDYKYTYQKRLHRRYGDLAAPNNRQYKNILRVYVPKSAKLLSNEGYSGYVKVYRENGRKVFEGLVTMEPGKSRMVALEYEQKLDEDVYRLLINKQPGRPIFDKAASEIKVVVRRSQGAMEAYYPEYSGYSLGAMIFELDTEYDRFVKVRFEPIR